MSIIRTGFTRPWEIRVPVLTRYLEKEYVEVFLKEGRIRLSSFNAFRNNPDEQKGDVFEGRASLQISTPNGNHAIVCMNGQEAYVLCAGTVENPNMESSFNTTHGELIFSVWKPIIQ